MIPLLSISHTHIGSLVETCPWNTVWRLCVGLDVHSVFSWPGQLEQDEKESKDFMKIEVGKERNWTRELKE